MEKQMDFRKYVQGLEEERRKIHVFRRELPLCLKLITQAIESSGSGTTMKYFNGGRSKCTEQTLGEVPVMEEFIPIKRSDFVDVEEESDEKNKKEEAQSDWLRSAQLWNQSPDSQIKVDVPSVVRNGGAFRPFQRDKTEVIKTNYQSPSPAGAASYTAETTSSGGAGSGRREKEGGGHSQRKQRRCWSPELHKRFLHVLQQLGGSHAATPKQIRELMKVDDLTNDEIKSHLQKYRLHTRRPPQFVVGEAVAGSQVNRIYAPVAAGRDSSTEASAV